MDPEPLILRTSFPEIWPFRQPKDSHMGSSTAVVGRNLRCREGGCAEESTVTGQSSWGGRNRRTRTDPVVSEDESSKLVSTSTANDLNDCDVKCPKSVGHEDENGNLNPDVEGNSGNCSKSIDQSAQPSEAPKQDYIHVRARRGQATDSHSLAERARREKISERMKTLQDLVPGCNKVIGKASVLDEIINYIQSLQCQVEFLSMKLETVNSRMNSSIEDLPVKDFGMQTFGNSPGTAFVSQPSRQYEQGSTSEWLHMQVGCGFERAT